MHHTFFIAPAAARQALVALVWAALFLAHTPAAAGEEILGEVHITTVASPQQGLEDPRFASGFVSRIALRGLFARGMSLAQALQEIGGLSVRQHSSLGQAAFVSIRGGSPRQLVVLLDGVRISVPAGIGFDIGQLSTEIIESVDVYRGAASVVHGGGALTGALQLNTGAPTAPGWDVSATTMAGSFGTWGASATADLASKSSGLRLGASWRQSVGEFDFVDEQAMSHQRTNNDHHRLGLLGAGNLRLGKHHLALSLLVEQGGGGSPGPSEFQLGFTGARTDDGRQISTLRWKAHDLAAGDWGAIDAHLGAGLQRRAFTYDNPRAFMTRERFHNASEHRVFSASSGLVSFLKWGNATYLDIEGRIEDFAVSSLSQPGDALQAERRVVGGALSNELLLASDAVSLIAGIRAEAIEDEAFSAMPVLPFGGVIWRAAPWLRFATNLARTFRAPDFDELYLDSESIRGDRALRPERALAWDAGAKLGGREQPVTFELAYFRSTIDEMILFLPVSAHLYLATNLQGARSHGLESNLHWVAHHRLGLRANYTLTRAFLLSEQSNPPAQLPHQPLHRTRLGAELELADLLDVSLLHSAQISATASYRSRIFLDNFANMSTPAAITMDLGLSLGIGRWLGLSFDLHNVLDDQQLQDSLQRPLPGRAFYVSARMSKQSLDP
ncbi:MAG: TonB-dependent receptor [Bradymonadaceae bacterium]|nr:TonB-dependent receptor [Lujinxingiaceae bacterium]